MAARPQRAVQALALQVLRPQDRGGSASPDGVSPSGPMPHSSDNARRTSRKPSYPLSSQQEDDISLSYITTSDLAPRSHPRSHSPKDRPYTPPKDRTKFDKSVPYEDNTADKFDPTGLRDLADQFAPSPSWHARTEDARLTSVAFYGDLRKSFADSNYGLYGKDIGPKARVPDDLEAHSGYTDEEDDSSGSEERGLFHSLRNESTEAVICSVDQKSITTRTDIFESGLRGKRRSLRKWAEDRDVEIIANLSDRTRSPSPG